MKMSFASLTSARAIAVSCRWAIGKDLSRAPRSSFTPNLSRTRAAASRMGLIAHETKPIAGQTFEGDVLGDGHFGEQRQILPDDGDAAVARSVRRDRRLGASPKYSSARAGLGRIDAGDDLDQRALAAAVLAGEAVDFAGADLESPRRRARVRRRRRTVTCSALMAGAPSPADGASGSRGVRT